jgi:hypothetical protein
MAAIDNMTIGFWHPFGTHARESREAIVLRKRAEIQADAWTLLSLQHGKCLDAWRALLPASTPIFVLG